VDLWWLCYISPQCFFGNSRGFCVVVRRVRAAVRYLAEKQGTELEPKCTSHRRQYELCLLWGYYIHAIADMEYCQTIHTSPTPPRTPNFNVGPRRGLTDPLPTHSNIDCGAGGPFGGPDTRQLYAEMHVRLYVPHICQSSYCPSKVPFLG